MWLIPLNMFFFFFARLSSMHIARFFFLIRRLAVRGDATTSDYGTFEYILCCDVLFIQTLAALLDWLWWLKRFTIALYSLDVHPFSFKCRQGKAVICKPKTHKNIEREASSDNKQLQLWGWPRADKGSAGFCYEANSMQFLFSSFFATSFLFLALSHLWGILVWHHPYFMAHHLDTHPVPLVYVYSDKSICQSSQYCCD